MSNQNTSRWFRVLCVGGIFNVSTVYSTIKKKKKNFRLSVELSSHFGRKYSKDEMSRTNGIILGMVFIQKEPSMLSVPFQCLYKQEKKFTSEVAIKIRQHNLSLYLLGVENKYFSSIVMHQ